ncbi:unnamed protein product [Amoebophrya sp. A25]|nr:unnamed protein product [Amoebophrya sp. A25]|eukprot:GSA25T00017388001.1
MQQHCLFVHDCAMVLTSAKNYESYIRIFATAARTIGDEVACRSTEDESPRRSETMIYYLKESAPPLDRDLDVEGTAIESPNTALQALRTYVDLMDQIVRTELACQRLGSG